MTGVELLGRLRAIPLSGLAVLFLAIAAGVASFLTAIYCTAYALHYITPS